MGEWSLSVALQVIFTLINQEAVCTKGEVYKPGDNAWHYSDFKLVLMDILYYFAPDINSCPVHDHDFTGLFTVTCLQDAVYF